MTYSLPNDLYLQVRAFLNHLASSCKSCVRKNQSCCDSCDAQTARILGEQMDSCCPNPIQAIQVDNSLANRMAVIVNQLRTANRPLRAIDIDTRDYCSKEQKFWTLGKLISLGKIRREKQGFFHVYSLVAEKTKRKN